MTVKMIEPIKARKCTEPDAYEKSAVWISLASEDGKYRLGSMQRCGVTPPGYPDRATYQRARHGETDIFVYDGGYFWNSKEWHAFYREHRKSPVEFLCPSQP